MTDFEMANIATIWFCSLRIFGLVDVPFWLLILPTIYIVILVAVSTFLIYNDMIKEDDKDDE